MTPRINFSAELPPHLKQLVDLSNSFDGCGLERSLLELVKTRASQINGCANCLNMHTAVARKNGETEPRLHLLAAWHEA